VGRFSHLTELGAAILPIQAHGDGAFDVHLKAFEVRLRTIFSHIS